MSVKYTFQRKGNPNQPEAAKKWYAMAKSDGEITLKELCSEFTGMNDSAVLAMLNELVKSLNRHLADGKIVRLGDFGSFQISFGSEGAETPEKFNEKFIREKKVIFRPGKDVKKMLKTVEFEKSSENKSIT